jgi:hypothetical protein
LLPKITIVVPDGIEMINLSKIFILGQEG